MEIRRERQRDRERGKSGDGWRKVGIQRDSRCSNIMREKVMEGFVRKTKKEDKKKTKEGRTADGLTKIVRRWER